MENEKEDKTENKCFNGSSIYGNGRSNYDRKTEIKEGSRGEKDDLKDGRKRDRQDSDNFQRDGKFVRRGKYFFLLFSLSLLPFISFLYLFMFLFIQLFICNHSLLFRLFNFFSVLYFLL